MTIDRKVYAIMPSGGKRGVSVRELYLQIRDSLRYGEWYIRFSHKAVRRLRGTIDGEKGEWPLLEFTLATLQNILEIEKIAVPGPKEMIEEALGNRIKRYDKAIFLEQGNSFGENVHIGYEELKKYGHVGNTFVIACDNPLVREESIREFLQICSPIEKNYIAIQPIVRKEFIEDFKKSFRRPLFRMTPDTMYPDDYVEDREGMILVRTANMGLIDLDTVTAEYLNMFYDCRKLLTAKNELKKALGAERVIEAYRIYRKQGLRLSVIENLINDKLQRDGVIGYVKVVGIRDGSATIDTDSEEDFLSMQDVIN